MLTLNYAPALPDDPDPIAGPGCAAAPIDYSLYSCVNGHPFYTSDLGPGVYGSPDPSGRIGIGDFPLGFDFRESQSGNLIFADGADFEAVVLDRSTLATTPEPSSFALLGTGLLGAGGVLRKRIA